MFLFGHGSAILIPLGIDAKQDAWIAVLLGMAGGLFMFFIHYRLYRCYPDMMPTEYIQKIIGKCFGKILACVYIVYFLYLAARILRDFGEMLVTFSYQETPLFITNVLLLLVIVYAVCKGIEVLARMGEFLFVLIYIFAVVGFLLLVISGVMDLNNLKPVLEEGIGRVLNTFFTQTWYVSFGEIIVFTMILPYVNRPKKVKIAGMSAIGIVGINLAIVMAVNITVLGVDIYTRSQFPLLSTIQSIQVAEFLERLDVFFMIALIIGGFIKVSIFFYAGVIGTSILFNVKEKVKLVYPLGIVVLFFSMIVASSISEHNYEGMRLIPLLLHLPLQIIIPVLLLLLAVLKKRH
ncbi:GerAB/ArcD/ProY family transporter [Alteribacillus bidgolensis]|uniref:Spore germination protein KB n=1 Tax=Alteribacillus bidgolensis TaxID=930129 RepID=A0A1G8H9Y4_9BACI|nr:GerAB/ArcD/ProY family transporter [Alteribacillus bidgolensis]SDI03447.1 spore germination protein KB [Alteribacillus bidgolensis]